MHCEIADGTPRWRGLGGSKHGQIQPLIRGERGVGEPSRFSFTTMTIFAKWSLVAITIASAASATPLSTYPHHSPSIGTPLSLAPLIVAEHPHDALNNSYIVRLKHAGSQALLANHINFLQAAHNADPVPGEDGGLVHVYDSHKFHGYSGRFSDGVVEQLRTMHEVEYVEQDQIVHTQAVQKGAPWVSHITALVQTAT